MRDRFLESAVQIGEFLCNASVKDNGRTTWPGLDSICGSNLRSDVDLLMGRAGIFIFLASLFRYRKTQRLSLLVEQMVQEIRHSIAAKKFYQYDFHERVDWGYCLFVLGNLLGERYFSEFGIDIILSGERQSHIRSSRDYWGAGSSGAYWGLGREIALLLTLYYRTGHENLRRLIESKSEKFIKHINYNSFGAHMKLLHVRPAPLLGFAHGSSGAIWILAELYRLYNDKNLKSLTYQMLGYEDSWLNIDQRDTSIKVIEDLWSGSRKYYWCDFRHITYPEKSTITALHNNYPVSDFSKCNEIHKSHFIAFCNGNPGILAARLKAYSIFQDGHGLEQVRFLLDAGLDLNISAKLHIFNVCCGIGGNIEAYLFAHTILQKNKYRDFCYDMARVCIDSYELTGEWRAYRSPSDAQMPIDQQRELDKYKFTYLKGIVGIGYFFLRVYDPVKTSSMLLPIEFEQINGSSSNDTCATYDIISNVRKREILRFFGHTVELFKRLFNIDMIKEYEKLYPSIPSQPEVVTVSNFLRQKISEVNDVNQKFLATAYSAEQYRIQFEKSQRIIMDRFAELYFCDSTTIPKHDELQVRIQRDVKFFHIPDLQLTYAFHIDRNNQPKVTQISERHWIIIKKLDRSKTIKDLEALIRQSDAQPSDFDAIIQAVKELIEFNILQKIPNKELSKT